jgi:hypothetical protein
MDKDVTAAFAFNESIPLGIVEPLDLTLNAHRSSSLLASAASCAAGSPSPATSFDTGAQKKTAIAASG